MARLLKRRKIVIMATIKSANLKFLLVLLLLPVIVGLVAIGCGSSTNSDGDLPIIHEGPYQGPKFKDNGDPVLAVVLVDGINSKAGGGSYYPYPVSNSEQSIPTVSNYYPVGSDKQPRDSDLPPGLHDSLRRWSELPERDNGGSAACTYPNNDAGGGGPGGFDTNTCLTARLADLGAVILPYSYNGGTTIDPSTKVVTVPAYGDVQNNTQVKNDTLQSPGLSEILLENEIASIHKAWKTTPIIIISHSLGGRIAEGWWFDYRQNRGENTQSKKRVVQLSMLDSDGNHLHKWDAYVHGDEDADKMVTHVFSLDSPINGIRRCDAFLLAETVNKGSVFLSQDFCDRWNGGNPDQQDSEIIKADGDDSYTAVGNPKDVAYDDSATSILDACGGPINFSGGGGLVPQLIFSHTERANGGDDVTSNTYSSPPNYVISDTCQSADACPLSKEDMKQHNLNCQPGDIRCTATKIGGHDIVKVCPDVVQMIVNSAYDAIQKSGQNQSSTSDCDLNKLKDLQPKTPYPVLVPTYLPASMKLDPKSIDYTATPDASREYSPGESPVTYSFSFKNEAARITFEGNNQVGLSAEPMTVKDLRGHKALVLASEPFEQSAWYVVLWHEDKDLTDPKSVQGAYVVNASNLSWDEVEKVMNSLKPADEINVNCPGEQTSGEKPQGPYATEEAAQKFVEDYVRSAMVNSGWKPLEPASSPNPGILSILSPESTWRPNATLHAIVAFPTPGIEGASWPYYYFFFVNGYLVGDQCLHHGAHDFKTQADDNTIAVDYKFYKGSEPACCPSGAATERFHWDGSKLVMLDPLQLGDPDPTKSCPAFLAGSSVTP